MADVFAGIACGFLLGGTSVVGLALVILYNPALFNGVLPKGLTPTALMLALALALPIAWGILGILFGLAYRAISQKAPDPGLGSPNLMFTVIILILFVIGSLPLALLRIKGWWALLALNIAFAGIFAWLLPYMAA